MNRRGFLESIIKAGAAYAILPSALTYARHWKPVQITSGAWMWIPNPGYETAEFEMMYISVGDDKTVNLVDEAYQPRVRYSVDANGNWIRHESHILTKC